MSDPLTRSQLETIMPRIMERLVELLDSGAAIEIYSAWGQDDVTAPGDQCRHSDLNETQTTTIKVNGGIVNRNRSTHPQTMRTWPCQDGKHYWMRRCVDFDKFPKEMPPGSVWPEEWVVAQFRERDGGLFFVCDTDENIVDSRIVEVGPEILPPGETHEATHPERVGDAPV